MVYKTSIALNGILENFSYDLVQTLQDQAIIDGGNICVDSTSLESYDSLVPKKDLDSDDHSAPSWRTKVDSHGNNKSWFGWKLHLGTDSLSEMLVAFQLTPASFYDSPIALPVIHTYHSLCEKNGFTKPNFYSMDAAYDTVEIYEKVRQEYGAQAIILINPRKVKEPPAGYPMVYWGHDNNSKKFRCPHVIGKVDCTFGTA